MKWKERITDVKRQKNYILEVERKNYTRDRKKITYVKSTGAELLI